MNPSPEDLTSPQARRLQSEYAIVYDRYVELNPKDPNPRDSVSRLVRETSLPKVEQYLDDLATAFGQLNPRIHPELRSSIWNFFLSGPINNPDTLVQIWMIDQDLNREFIRLAFFYQYPKWAAADEVTFQRMLEVLAAPSRTAGEELLNPAPLAAPDPQHLASLKEGYKHDYLRNDIIAKPILQRLSKYAKDWTSTKYFAPYTALIGPSMIGKTRLIMKLAESICVVYICLRAPESNGLPPRSVLADEMALTDKKAPQLVVHFYRLLAAIFDVVAEFFSCQIAGDGEQQRLLQWYNYNQESGGDFATRVRDTMKAVGQDESSASIAFTEKLKKLESSTTFISNPELKVLLSLDEARALIQLESKDDQNLSYFRALRRVLSNIPPKLKFFVTFTDTTSLVANFLPALRNDPSARPPPDSKELYPPIYAIGTFDSKVSSSPPKTWDELLSPRRLFSYGVPFFRIYVETVEKPPQSLRIEVIIENVRKMAIEKLLCIPPASQQLSEGQVFALLGCTIQPQIYEAAKLNSDLVSSHLAHCLYISPTRERLISEYPSQFALSVAANHFLAEDDSRLIACIKALTAIMHQGLISSGNSGELVSRIILLRAMQKAMSISPIHTEQADIPYGCSVRLADFLKALTGKDEPIGEKKTSQKRKRPGQRTAAETGNPTNTKEPGFFELNMDDNHQARLLSEGRIFWNHFSQITYTPQPVDLLKFLYRGLAVQCKPNQRGFDQMFPIYLASGLSSSPLTKSRISFCGVQAKNAAFPFKEEGPKWDAKYAEVKLDGETPYLIILFSFKTKWTDDTLPEIPHRGSLIFHGLDNIACLTPEISIALNELLSVTPDVRRFVQDNEHIRQFVEITRACAYRLDDPEEESFDADD